MDVGNQITIERWRAGRLQMGLKTGRQLERLAAMGGRDPASAERAKELGKQLQASWTNNYAILTSQWPVDPTRGCGYPALQFRSALYGSDAARDKAILLEARAGVESCLAKAQPALRAMKASNDELETVAAKAEAALAAAGLASQ
ncbi:MAG TPA: hypothetical protein VFR85_13765, partial [Anaeromyxobacteraceae bacterium]|nr:hypothetical protein [Anaeromyxobacteraceae bacterium]